MRDPERIEEILDLFRTVWKKAPDLRFCQIVKILEAKGGVEYTFYTEDHIIKNDLIKFKKELESTD